MPSIRRFHHNSVKRTCKTNKTNEIEHKIKKNEINTDIYNFGYFSCDDILSCIDTNTSIFVNIYDTKNKENRKYEEMYKNMNSVLDELLYCYHCKCCKSFVGTKYLKLNYCSFICYFHKK
jgi:hypothetical protein